MELYQRFGFPKTAQAQSNTASKSENMKQGKEERRQELVKQAQKNGGYKVD
ncbi:hypothetical protein N9R79_06480 [Vibrio sp.]|nr:hypothetical protein [Vibrio sp.]